MSNNTALIIENPQIDFFAGGAMEVSGADTLLPILNQLIASFERVIVSLDWHPANHISFAANHPWRQIGQIIEQKETLIELKPIHCVQNTFGSMLHPSLVQKERLFKVYKGETVDREDENAFFDKGLQPTTLQAYLQSEEIKELYVAGMVLEDNVLATLLEGLQLGYKMHIFKNACGSRLAKETMANFWTYTAAKGIGIKEDFI